MCYCATSDSICYPKSLSTTQSAYQTMELSLSTVLDLWIALRSFKSRPAVSASNHICCYKWVHCLLYLAITTPDGLILYMYGPEEGLRHDITLYRKSNLDVIMEQGFMIAGDQYYAYGNSGFVMRP